MGLLLSQRERESGAMTNGFGRLQTAQDLSAAIPDGSEIM